MEGAFFIGILASAIFGYLVIAVFLRHLQFSTRRVFIYYRVIFGIIVLALALFFRLPVAAGL
jgi:undecaprenyl-diphosphatase